MHYVNTNTGKRVSETDIRLAHPETSFPHPFEIPDGYAALTLTYPPAHNQGTHQAKEVDPVLADGVWKQAWEIVALSADEVLSKAKAARAAQVGEITVTTASGKVFDGNEDAQNRMSRALAAMDDADTLPWVLHDNTVAAVGKAEMREALRLAGAAMAAIWVAPYTQE